MNLKRLFLIVTFVIVAITATAVNTKAQMSAGINVSDMKFIQLPVLPTCLSLAVQNGDPSKGPSIILLKLESGCSIPWHWHTPNEHLMLVSGNGTAQMKDGKPMNLTGGGYALMPATHVHQFKCDSSCLLYLYSDGAFDIHYVDAKGNEMTPDAALKAVNEKGAK